MAKAFTTLMLSKQVANGTTEYHETNPFTLGDQIEILLFQGDAAYQANAYVALIWDYKGITVDKDTILWSIKGSSVAPHISSRIALGGEKLALVLNNSVSGPLLLSGVAELLIRS